MAYLLQNLLHFTRLLHALGLDVHAGRMIDVFAALEHIDIGNRSDFYYALRSLLVHRPQDLARFDEAFRMFWRPPPELWSTRDLDAMGQPRRVGRPQVEALAGDARATEQESLNSPDLLVERTAPLTYSGREVSRVKDFARFTDEELRHARAVIAAMTWNLGLRKTHRWTAGPRGAPDLRRVARHNLRYGGEPFKVPHRERTLKRRSLILLCDVSGSMDRYARMLLYFIQTLAGGLDRVESFLFATRLTRITRELARGGLDDVVPAIPRRTPDWGGGTRIGSALRSFNILWARRVLGHGAVVLLISDGWDRGDPDLIRRELGRLHRSCHRLIWLNPLLGSQQYQPLTRGMQAALPFVDDFLPVHNLSSLDALAAHLNALPPRRIVRRVHASLPKK
jgi:uncharacterized protein with von Willebrand factor type A (vWA) domain